MKGAIKLKIVGEEVLLDKGAFSSSKEYSIIKNDIHESILDVVWPNGSSDFCLYPERKGNGVKPIKDNFINSLERRGWVKEKKIDIGPKFRPGPLDACYQVGGRYFAVEWETGNISSSHRAVNKMALGILNKFLIGGILILPSKDMYYYLTDRIGNFPELAPYFPLWQSLECDEGYLEIISIEHDRLSKDVEKIPKGTDGRALV